SPRRPLGRLDLALSRSSDDPAQGPVPLRYRQLDGRHPDRPHVSRPRDRLRYRRQAPCESGGDDPGHPSRREVKPMKILMTILLGGALPLCTQTRAAEQGAAPKTELPKAAAESDARVAGLTP